MDPISSPRIVSISPSTQTSAHGSQRPSVFGGGTTAASPAASQGRGKPNRSVKFDPTISGGIRSGAHSNEQSLDTSFDHSDANDGDGLTTFSPFSPGSAHELEDLPPFELTRDDVVAAFEFLDVNGSGVLTMNNLKHRLSAFYPQLTTKEYKFLIEDPNGGTGGNGGLAAAAASASHHGSSPPTQSQQQQHGGGARGAASGLAANASSGATEGGGPAASPGGVPGDASPPDGGMSSESGLLGSGSRGVGARAGVDVDQLWDLISSFQQLQRNLGVGQGNGEPHSGLGSRNTSNAAFNHNLNNFLVGSPRQGGARGAEGGFDAVAEAFRIYDPRGSHYVEEEVLSRIMARVGFGELNEEELALLVSTADFDGDGRISLDDFRRLVNMKGRFKK